MDIVEPSAKRINGKLWMNFDPYIDVGRLESLEFEIIKGVSLAYDRVEPLTLGSINCQFDKSIKETSVWMGENKDDPELAQLRASGATFKQQYDFVRFRHGTADLGEKLMLRAYDNYIAGFARKHIARLNKDREAYKFFPGIRSFLNDSGAFKEIGRTVVYLTPPGYGVPTHADYSDGISRRDQFLWLNIRCQKKFFVLDENLQKDYITSQCGTFDNASWHGSDPVPPSTISVRIDGIFSDEWLEKTGTTAHYKQPRKALRV